MLLLHDYSRGDSEFGERENFDEYSGFFYIYGVLIIIPILLSHKHAIYVLKSRILMSTFKYVQT